MLQVDTVLYLLREKPSKHLLSPFPFTKDWGYPKPCIEEALYGDLIRISENSFEGHICTLPGIVTNKADVLISADALVFVGLAIDFMNFYGLGWRNLNFSLIDDPF